MSYYMAPSREALTAMLTEQQERLKRWVAKHTTAEMERPITPGEAESAEKWRAKDHLAHALEVEVYLQEAAQQALAQGTALTEFSAPVEAQDRESVMRAINQAVERAFAQAREESTEGLLERQGKTRQATLELLASLSDERLNQTTSHAPFERGTVRDIFQQIAWHDERYIDWLTEAFAQASE